MSLESSAPATLDAFWMPFTANRQFKASTAHCWRAPTDMHYWTPDGRPDPRRRGGAVVRECRPRPAGNHRGRQPADRRRWITRRRSRWAIRWPSSWPLRSSRLAPPGLDHVFFTNSGSEVGRYGAQDRDRLAPRPRRGCAHAPDRARARLPRRRLRRHLGRRHGQQPQVLRPAAAGRRSPARTRTTRRATPSRAACRCTVQSSPTSSSAWSRCTMPRRSPPSSSSRSPVRPACCCRPRATCSACANSARSTASC